MLKNAKWIALTLFAAVPSIAHADYRLFASFPSNDGTFGAVVLEPTQSKTYSCTAKDAGSGIQLKCDAVPFNGNFMTGPSITTKRALVAPINSGASSSGFWQIDEQTGIVQFCLVGNIGHANCVKTLLGS
jgi:hypothetical protein